MPERGGRADALSSLPRYLALVYALLVGYACLHPLSGWRLSGLPIFDFLSAPWPRYYTVADIVFNVIGYLPLGFLLVPSLPARLPRSLALVLTVLAGALLSFSMETLQNFLPTRVPSNLDLGSNTLGALLGALAGLRWGPPLFDQRAGLHRWREAQILPGAFGDLGLMLLGLWLLTQLAPSALLFENGDVRGLLGLPMALPFSPERYLRFEAAVIAVSTLAAGLFASCLQRANRAWLPLLALAGGVAVKILATTAFFESAAPLGWLTPGTRAGLLAAPPVLALLLLLPLPLRQSLASFALVAATLLVNLMPESPYLFLDEQLRPGSGFLHFHGLTELTASLWPFLALIYLNALARRPQGGG